MIAESKHEIGVLCVISETEYIEVCNQFGFDWVFAPNDPLGDKINTGIKKALTYKPDYIMTMNSDSVIKAELLDVWYQPHFDKMEEFFGVDTVTFINSETNEAREFFYEFTILGVGKCMRADVVERCFKVLGELYRAKLNKCLDNTMMDNLMRIKCFPKMVKYKGQLVFDIKSDVNIWPWKFFENKGKKVEPELCYTQG